MYMAKELCDLKLKEIAEQFEAELWGGGLSRNRLKDGRKSFANV